MNLTGKMIRLGRLALSPRAYEMALRDIFHISNHVLDDDTHLHAVIEWILRAQNHVQPCGISAWYCLGEGWHAPYPETTGYIISTCLDYADIFGRDDVYEAALRMGEWTLTKQESNGGVTGGTKQDSSPIVFNTAQCMLGWHRLAVRTEKSRYLEALAKAADWLIYHQNEDGKWTKYSYMNVPHTYHSRVAWALLKTSDLLKERKYYNAAVKNLEWCLTNRQDNNWLRNMGFIPGAKVLTHTIAYTYRGLFESSVFLDVNLRHRILKVVNSAGEKLLHLYERRKITPYGKPMFLPGTIDENWCENSSYSCLTGNAQIAIIWLKLFKLNNDWRFMNASLKMIDQLKSCQNLSSGNGGIRGGIPSSMPIYGGYLPMRYLNWSAKFFADALILTKEIMEKYKGKENNPVDH